MTDRKILTDNGGAVKLGPMTETERRTLIVNEFLSESERVQALSLLSVMQGAWQSGTGNALERAVAFLFARLVGSDNAFRALLARCEAAAVVAVDANLGKPVATHYTELLADIRAILDREEGGPR